jgi:nucleoid-associated protein YejK
MTNPDTSGQHWDVHARLEDPMGVLAIALGQWEARDDTKAQPHVRQAANTAMDAIDEMLSELHQMRSRLVGEIRASDDATAARVDAMLADTKDRYLP